MEHKLEGLRCQCDAVWKYTYKSEEDRLHVLSNVLKDCNYGMTLTSDPPVHEFFCNLCHHKVHISDRDKKILDIKLQRK